MYQNEQTISKNRKYRMTYQLEISRTSEVLQSGSNSHELVALLPELPTSSTGTRQSIDNPLGNLSNGLSWKRRLVGTQCVFFIKLVNSRRCMKSSFASIRQDEAQLTASQISWSVSKFRNNLCDLDFLHRIKGVSCTIQ